MRVQLPESLRTSTDVIARAQVRTGAGALVDVGSLGEIRESTGPSQIDRQSRQRQVTVYASLEGKALGDALNEVKAIAKEVVPPHIDTAVAGMGENLEESNQSMGFSMMLAVICIYMILASQFESLIHPFTIMVSLPFALIGAFGGLLIAHMHMSIFAMIGTHHVDGPGDQERHLCWSTSRCSCASADSPSRRRWRTRARRACVPS